MADFIDAHGPLCLLVDDSQIARLLIRRVLETLGFETTEAENGREALKTLEAGDALPALVLTDWNMPEMDGPGLIREIRNRAEYQGLKVVLCSSTEDAAERDLALSLGADEFIRKPFTASAFEDKLRGVGLAIAGGG